MVLLLNDTTYLVRYDAAVCLARRCRKPAAASQCFQTVMLWVAVVFKAVLHAHQDQQLRLLIAIDELRLLAKWEVFPAYLHQREEYQALGSYRHSGQRLALSNA
eukprot:1028055-Pleurochrysis_carterae.AAC.2